MTDDVNFSPWAPQPPMESAEPTRPPRPRRRPWRVVYWVTLGLLAAILVGAIVYARVSFSEAQVPSAGMAPAVPAGSKLFYQRGAGDVVPGDIVIAQTPNGLLVRRVIGLPGDRVSCCDAAGLVDVDGKALDESYLGPGVAPSTVTFAVTLGPGQLWLMADNRDDAYDSRGWGPLPVSDIVGRVVEVSRPGGWTQLRTPETFIADGLAPADTRPALVFPLLGAAGLAALAIIVQGIVGIILWTIRRRRRRPSEAQPQPQSQPGNA